MPQSLAQIWIHIIFSTRERKPFLRRDDFRDEMFRMLAHVVEQERCLSASAGGHVNHVHLLIGLSRSTSVANLVGKLKAQTSKWAKSHAHGSSLFGWQSGYGAFSVSHSLRHQVDRYIRSQAEHHAQMTFQEEFRRICAKHNITLNEDHAWD